MPSMKGTIFALFAGLGVAVTAMCGCTDDKHEAGPDAGKVAPHAPSPDAVAPSGSDASGSSVNASTKTSFFVSSDTSKTANLGGLSGADARCARLAAAASLPHHTWQAYLSTEHGGDADGPINARDRIGTGPWYNVKGVKLADDLDTLHSRTGDPEIFL